MPDENAEADDHTGDPPDDHADDGGSTETGSGEHAAPEGAPLHPLIDLSRDPTPGKPDHARPEDDG